MKTTKTPPSKCPACGEPTDAATATGRGTRPREGDASMCLSCGHMMIFNADLTMRNPTDEETALLNASESIQWMQAQRRAIMARRRS